MTKRFRFIGFVVLLILCVAVLVSCGSGGSGGGGGSNKPKKVYVTDYPAIVGSWYEGTTSQTNNLVVMAFFSGGTYIFAQDGDDISDPSGTDGIERGTFSWDSTTGGFTTTTTVDTNGEWGYSHRQGNQNIQINGNTMTLTSDAVVGSYTASRMSDTTGSILGSWYSTLYIPESHYNTYIVMAFFSDGTYIFAQDGDDISDPSGKDGIERGAFSWDSTTGAFTTTTTVDTNGEWGFSHRQGNQNIQINGNTMTLTSDAVDGSYTARRIERSLSYYYPCGAFIVQC